MQQTQREQEVILKHIDQLFSGLNRVWDLQTKVVALLIVTPLALLAVAGGLGSATNQYPIGETGISLPAQFIFFVGLYGVPCLLLLLNVVSWRAAAAGSEIQRLYRAVGYNDGQLGDRFFGPLTYPSVPSIVYAVSQKTQGLQLGLWTRWNVKIANLGLGLVILGLPFVGQLVAVDMLWPASSEKALRVVFCLLPLALTASSVLGIAKRPEVGEMEAAE